MDPITISTIVLVIITAYYAWQTRRTVKEIQLQRKDTSLPMIVSGEFQMSLVESQEHYCTNVQLENLGKGPAFNVEIFFLDSETREEILYSDHILPFVAQGDKSDCHIHIPVEQLDNLRFEETEDEGLIVNLICSIRFQDIYKRTITSEQFFVYQKEEQKITPVLGEFNFNLNS